MTDITLPRAELQQVLEAMENFGTDWDGWHRAYMALRERLAQPEPPEQEPAYRCRPYSSVPNAKVSPPVDYYTTPQPRTWAGSRRSPAWWETRAPQPRTWAGSGDLEDSNAYVTPPQRTWVELTDADIDQVSRSVRDVGYAYERALLAKFKEKNT